MCCCHCELVKQTQRIADALEHLVALGRHALRPPRPEPITIILTGENGMSLSYKLTLPPAGASDVTERRLTVNGVTSVLPGSAIEATGFSGQQGDTVSVTLVDVDDAGNASPERAQTFLLSDTIPPPQPGEIGLAVTDET